MDGDIKMEDAENLEEEVNIHTVFILLHLYCLIEIFLLSIFSLKLLLIFDFDVVLDKSVKKTQPKTKLRFWWRLICEGKSI